MSTANILYLVYDEECPLCSHAARYVKIRQAVGEISLINARDDHPLVHDLMAQAYDLDKGIVVVYDGSIFYGPEAMRQLATLAKEDDLFNRINALLFRSQSLSTVLYPIFKGFRRCLLWILRVKPIAHDQ